MSKVEWTVQSTEYRQSTKLFLQSSELGLPQPLTRRRVCASPLWFRGEGRTRWRERGWESPNSDEGHTLWHSWYTYVLCGPKWHYTARRLLTFTKLLDFNLFLPCIQYRVFVKRYNFLANNAVERLLAGTNPSGKKNLPNGRGGSTCKNLRIFSEIRECIHSRQMYNYYSVCGLVWHR